MVLKGGSNSSQVAGNNDDTVNGSPTISGGGTLKQVSLLLDPYGRVSTVRRGSKNIKKSQIGVEYNGSPEWLPEIVDVKNSQPEVTHGTPLINVTTFNDTARTYGYYAICDSDFDDDININVRNGGSVTANYYCTYLYDQ